MKENPNIILTSLTEGISRIKIDDSSNYNALSSKNINRIMIMIIRISNFSNIGIITYTFLLLINL